MNVALRIKVIAPNREKEAKKSKPYSQYWEGYITYSFILNADTPAVLESGEFTYSVNNFPNGRVVQVKKGNDLYAPMIKGFFAAAFTEGVAKKHFLEMLPEAESAYYHCATKIIPLDDELINWIISES